MKFLFSICSLFIPLLCCAEGVHPPIPCFLKAVSSNDILAERADTILKKCCIGLSREQLIAAFLDIESGAPHKAIKMPYCVEKSKKLNKYIIRDIQSKEAYIGRGCHKVVKKAIIYGHQPKVIADCVSDASARQEIFFLKKLRGIEGLVKFYGSVKRKKKYSIYLEYFQQGSLASQLDRGESLGSHTFKIAFDIAKGLRGMHQKKLVHRDLHPGNVLLEISNEHCRAVLVDFGKTFFAYRAKSVIPQIPRTKNPPEGLIKSFSKIDRYKADIYGLGCLFYQMATGEQNPWCAVFNIYKIKHYSKARKKGCYKKIVSSYQETKEKILGGILQKRQTGEALNSHEKFLILIFSMLDFEPQRRPTIEQVVDSLGELQ